MKKFKVLGTRCLYENLETEVEANDDYEAEEKGFEEFDNMSTPNGYVFDRVYVDSVVELKTKRKKK